MLAFVMLLLICQASAGKLTKRKSVSAVRATASPYVIARKSTVTCGSDRLKWCSNNTESLLEWLYSAFMTIEGAIPTTLLAMVRSIIL